MPTPAPPSDLTPGVFLALRSAFFAPGPVPAVFPLRDKRNTQDDPLDEYIHQVLETDDRLATGTHCSKAPGPLISPDLVVLRPELCEGALRSALRSDLSRIVAIEVKKLERSGRMVARASGLDYNTTPPCGTVRVYDRSGEPLDIRGFYLFVCQEPAAGRANHFTLTAMVLCDGDLLNADFDLYLSIVGRRTKQIDLGTYADGANRTRPMFIFGNPLGVDLLDRHVTLIHPRADLAERVPALRQVGRIRRTTRRGEAAMFHCYRAAIDVPAGAGPFDLIDPFHVPTRTEATQARGRFRIAVQPAD